MAGFADTTNYDCGNMFAADTRKQMGMGMDDLEIRHLTIKEAIGLMKMVIDMDLEPEIEDLAWDDLGQYLGNEPPVPMKTK